MVRVALVLAVLAASALPAAAGFVTFESGQVRPLALSPDGTRLFAVNTPDGRLEILDVGAEGLTRAGSVPVGLEPVAVAARTAGEVWVVNHLSDSISIVDVAADPPRVVRTLLVGDEPRDIVFAGPGRTRAFVTTAHRGQNGPVDPQLTTPGIGRADVWVFDAQALGTSLGGTPLGIVTLFGDTPRALAASPDGSTVWAAVFHSGNQTTALSEGLVCNGGAVAASCNVGGFTMPGGLPAPNTNVQGVPQRETGLIVKWNPIATQWQDELGRNWNDAVRFSLPDDDVFAIDAMATPPVATTAIPHVGTVLFDMAVNPVSGKVYVTNTDARNDVRFEGPGTAFGSTTVQGHLHETRITVIDGGTALPRHLNKHLDYDVRPAPPSARAASLATPMGMAVNAAGTTLYVAAFGSSRIGVFDTAALEADTFTPDAATHIAVSGGGPSGLVLDEARGRLYVLTRFDNAVKVIDTGTRTEAAGVTLHSPEPESVRTGRPVLYDAVLSSSNGEASCASCHVFGDFDSLAWDLGNPDDDVLTNPNPIRLGGIDPSFHPLKGPMTTQSLRGMAEHGPMHWRGDRTGGNDPGGDPVSEEQAFAKFAPAFEGLLGRAAPIDAEAMARFTAFILQVTYPPNPIRALDDGLSPDASVGRDIYFGGASDIVFNCDGCHTLAPTLGFFGSDGASTFENEPQVFKVPHLRNLYQKVGMFGMPQIPFLRPGNNGPQGPQVRGFGFLHDGSVDTLFRFHQATVFSLTPEMATQVERFMFEFDSNLKPIVGQQITLTDTNAAAVGDRIDLLVARDAAGDCEVVVQGVVGGEARGYLRTASGEMQADRAAEPLQSVAALRALAAVAGQPLTWTCVPPDSGVRMALDRDGDGFFDRDELDAGSDPADPSSVPGGEPPPPPGMTLVASTRLELRDRRNIVRFVSRGAITPPARGSDADPTTRGATLHLYNSAGVTTDAIAVELHQSLWTALGPADRPRGYRFRQGQVRVVMKGDRIVVRSRFNALGYTLNEPRQERIGVRLVLGGALTWCTDTAAKGRGTPRTTARFDRRGRFTGAPKTPPPAACPELPTGSPNGAFL
jgi:DNA-binding beta-propeller fold protein YncE